MGPSFLTSALDEGGRSALTPGISPPPGTHWIRRWLGLRADLDVLEKRNILYYRESKPGIQAVTRYYTD
jgi:hypothetical protein